ncbi:MAG: DUF2791 family P-loop domain-containing protein, partial [Clostridia bacterium]|nr:DUF2791 family P-loop domain-containing protein [Clostridia bacterium]
RHDLWTGRFLYNESRITVDDLAVFIRIEYERIGADRNITPREVIRDYIEVLDLLYQNPSLKVGELLNSDTFTYSKSEAVSDESDAAYAEFTV